MSQDVEKAMNDLKSTLSFGGGGGRGGGGGGGGNRIRNAIATGVCWTAGGAAGTVVGFGTAAVTKNPVVSWTAGVAAGGMVGDICTGVLKK